MRYSEFFTEGATMTAAYKDDNTWTYPDAYAKDPDVEAPYLSNASVREILSTLGLDPDFEENPPMPIDQFIGVSTQWLKKNIGKQSPEEEPTVTKQPGSATMISGGRPEGYFNQIIMQLNQVARKTKEKYPNLTHIYFA